MFKNDKNKKDVDIEKWLQIIHNDLYLLHNDNQEKKNNNNQKLRKELAGFRDSLLYDACSGVGYIYDNKYHTLESMENILKNMENIDEIDAARVINVDYLLSFIEQILRK